MGHIHDTKSDIMGFEERRESAYIKDISDDSNHMFFHHATWGMVRSYIVAKIMRQAGDAFSNSDEAKADFYKSVAEVIRNTDIDVLEPNSVEVSKEWLKDLYEFLNSKPKVMEE